MKKKSIWMGFLGLLGFRAFSYFWTHDPVDLCSAGWFAYFAYFFLAKLQGELEDERYLQDVREAKVFAFHIAAAEMGGLFLFAIFAPGSPVFPFAVSICFAVLVLSYSIKLYLLEER